MPRRVFSTLVAATLIGGGTLGLSYTSKVNLRLLHPNAFLRTELRGESFPKTLVQADGSQVAVQSSPKRVVSTVLAVDEVLSEILPPSHLIGVSRFASNPALSNCIEKIPPFALHHDGSVEQILRLLPDIVFVSGYSSSHTVKLLYASDVPVVRLDSYSSFSDIFENIRLIGQAVGFESKAQVLIERMESRIQAVRNRVKGYPKPRVLFYSPGGFTAGIDTVIDERITLAGGRNIAREAGLRGVVSIPLELAISLQPEIIILAGGGNIIKNSLADEIAQDPRWQSTPAVKQKAVFFVKYASLTSLSQYAVEGLEETARTIHPEAYL